MQLSPPYPPAGGEINTGRMRKPLRAPLPRDSLSRAVTRMRIAGNLQRARCFFRGVFSFAVAFSWRSFFVVCFFSWRSFFVVCFFSWRSFFVVCFFSWRSFFVVCFFSWRLLFAVRLNALRAIFNVAASWV